MVPAIGCVTHCEALLATPVSERILMSLPTEQSAGERASLRAWSRVLLCVAVCGALTAAPAVVLAQEEVAKVDVDAEFGKAQEAFAAARYAEALVSLEKVYAIEPDPVILYNIARCHQELEHWDEAAAAFDKALADEALPDPLRQEAVVHAETVRQKRAAIEAEKQKPPVVEPEPAATLAQAYVAPHIGVVVPQLFTDLGSWPIFGLECGYVLPFDVGPFIRPLIVALDVMYTAPGATGSGTDSNLGESGGAYDWELSEQMLVLELTAAWRFMPLGESLSAYGQIGPRLYLLESVLTASGAGGDFGEHRETDTNVGFVAAGGLDLQLGPGSAFAALELGYSGLDQKITGDSNTGALNIELGYRLQF